MSEEEITITLIVIAALAIPILCLRLIGWGLGISEIRTQQEKANLKILKALGRQTQALQDLITIQTAIAKTKGITVRATPASPPAEGK